MRLIAMDTFLIDEDVMSYLLTPKYANILVLGLHVI